jgi:hypothetical protein
VNAPNGSLCICGWNVVVVTISAGLLMLTYGEIEGRRRSQADRDAHVEAWLEGQRTASCLDNTHDDHCG